MGMMGMDLKVHEKVHLAQKFSAVEVEDQRMMVDHGMVENLVLVHRLEGLWRLVVRSMLKLMLVQLLEEAVVVDHDS